MIHSRTATLGLGLVLLAVVIGGLADPLRGGMAVERALAAPVPPVNPPPLPSSFYGSIRLQSGANVPSGTLVSALIGTTKVAETATFVAGNDSVYRIDVPADFADTPAVEGRT